MSIESSVAVGANVGPAGGPFHRSIVALDLEGSTRRTNLVKAELRRLMYDLLRSALAAADIAERHLEQLTDRGDGVLVLIRPTDDVPKPVLLSRLIPTLTDLLAEHNAQIQDPAMHMRLRAVVHAGEVHWDANGFFGESLDIAFRLLDAQRVKRALKEAVAGPVALVVSDEIFSGVVRQGYVPDRGYQRVRVRVAGRQHHGHVHIPTPTPRPAEHAAVPAPREGVRTRTARLSVIDNR